MEPTLLLALAIAPVAAAKSRHHRDTLAIAVLNGIGVVALFAGAGGHNGLIINFSLLMFAIIALVVALVWACTGHARGRRDPRWKNLRAGVFKPKPAPKPSEIEMAKLIDATGRSE